MAADTAPDYLTETEESIRARMLAAIPDNIDKSEGSYVWDPIAAAAIEFYQVSLLARQLLANGFAQTAASTVPGFRSSYLEMRAEERGIARRAAVKARGIAKFLGTPGTKVSAGTIIATPADPATGMPSVEYITLEAALVDPTGAGVAGIEARLPGIEGNVAAGAISILTSPIPGVTGVTNETPIAGGLDAEEDVDYLARYLQAVRAPAASGNKADYINWAMEVPGVGAVAVVPVKYGPGTVSVAILDANREPAGQVLIDAVQEHIAPPLISDVEAEDMTIGGYGAAIDATQTDDSGDSVKMEYNIGGDGTLIHALSAAILPEPGIWQVRVSVKADAVAGEQDLLRIGVWNYALEDWCPTTPAGGMPALITLKGSDLETFFTPQTVEFYWNGVDPIEFRLARLATEASTTIWVDRVVFRSTFSDITGAGKAPIGARVYVEQAEIVLINVSATLTIKAGYNADSVRASVTQNLRTYIQGLAFAADNDVLHSRIETIISDTTGVYDRTGVLVNGGTGNITIGDQQIAVLGTVTLT